MGHLIQSSRNFWRKENCKGINTKGICFLSLIHLPCCRLPCKLDGVQRFLLLRILTCGAFLEITPLLSSITSFLFIFFPLLFICYLSSNSTESSMLYKLNHEIWFGRLHTWIILCNVEAEVCHPLLTPPLNRFFRKSIPRKAFLFCGLIFLRVPSTIWIITIF